MDTSDPAKLRILLLSSHSRPTSTAPINHQVYCERHGYEYLFDVTPYRLRSRYDQKLMAVLSNSERADWLMWLDDDAYIMNHSVSLDRFIPEERTTQFVFCNSPVNPNGEWTVLNSGVFFMRNSTEARNLLIEALETDIDDVKAWWRPDQFGLFTDGDQDKLIYVFAKHDLFGTAVQIVPFSEFNSRVYHYTDTYDQHFVCHFCGFTNKSKGLQQLQRRFGLNSYLLPGMGARYTEPFSGSLFVKPDVKKRAVNAAKQMRDKLVAALSR